MTSTQVQTAPTDVTCPEWCVENVYDCGVGVYHRGTKIEIGDHWALVNEYNNFHGEYADQPATVVLNDQEMTPEQAALLGARLMGLAYQLKPDMPNVVARRPGDGELPKFAS